VTVAVSEIDDDDNNNNKQRDTSKRTHNRELSQRACGDSHTNNDALSKHLNCSSVSDECRSRAGRVFHEVEPDEQNARGPMEAVSDLGMRSLYSSEERRCGRPDKVDRITHALVRYSGVRPCKQLYTSKAEITLHL